MSVDDGDASGMFLMWDQASGVVWRENFAEREEVMRWIQARVRKTAAIFVGYL